MATKRAEKDAQATQTDEPEQQVEPDPADAPCPVCGLRRGNRCSHV